jgi:uncharacterized protein (DUF1810 family)
MSEDLHRFKRAQADGVHEDAMDELRAGAKRNHWIWFEFPQLKGLGGSEVARRFSLEDFAEAEDYFDDALLRARLNEGCEIVREQLVDKRAELVSLMGSRTDALKLVSSLTLFEQVAGDQFEHLAFAKTVRAVLGAAEKQGFARCAFTLRALRES